MVRVDLDPSNWKVAAVAVLIFIYSLIGQSGIMSVLENRMPEAHEFLYFLLFAAGADAVYLLSFLGISTPEEKKPA